MTLAAFFSGFMAWITEFSSKSSPIDFVLILSHWDIFLIGIKNTVLLVLVGLSFGAVIALPMAIARWKRVPFLAKAIGVFVYVFRGSPMLVQAYVFYYGLAQFEAVRNSFLWPVLREPWWCAAIAFAINSAAYQVEIYRGGLDAVPRGEIEATAAIGMSQGSALRHVILPSALRRCLPMIANESIFLLHGSAIASMLTITDVLGAGRKLNAQYYLAYEGFMALVFIITRILGWVERRTLKHLALQSMATREQTQMI